ncbi:MND1-interacting protein 1 [Vitis vinifera]|uniref:MND1-interacting protein 1 n=1 Tax=Vitis vinifera TaxID=29760 RepID=A0A438EQH7_VITVI|nr:MND1-interacting protein 1 [Vitis vinifera]
MGCTVREKHIRTTRRPRSVKTDNDHASAFDRASISKSIFDAGLKPLGYHVGVHDSGQNPNPNPNFDDSGWGYCTEEQLEEILLKNLEFLYNEAISKLVALGYDDDVAPEGDTAEWAFSNVNSDEAEPVFSDLRQLEEYSLAGMICLLQQVRPHLTKGDAMWCLLMCDLHVGRASTIEIPVLPSPINNNGCGGPVNSNANVESVNGSSSVGVAVPPLCKFHGGWGFGNGPVSEFPANGLFQCSTDVTLQRDIECPKRFNLSPSMKSLLKRNVAMFAAGFRASSKQLQTQSQACPSSVSSVDSTTGIVSGPEVPVEQYEDPNNSKNLDMVNTVLSKFREMNLDENLEFVAEDQKDEMVLTLIHQIKELDRQVKERREWAHQRAMQAARKLSHDLTELKMLRMEMEETQQLKKGKQTLEDTTMKRLSDMENALRKASGQVDRANAAVRRLETENAEIRAEMEASKLSASESVLTCLEVAKREKKCLKRLLAWEKQKTKLQEEIGEEKRKIVDLQQQMVRVEQAQKEAEVCFTNIPNGM